MLAMNRTSADICPSARKVQMFTPLVAATPSSVKYIQTEMAMIAGAAMAATRSTDLIPSAVLAT